MSIFRQLVCFADLGAWGHQRDKNGIPTEGACSRAVAVLRCGEQVRASHLHVTRGLGISATPGWGEGRVLQEGTMGQQTEL